MKKLILRATYKVWHPAVNKLLCRAYHRRVINSEQLHILAAMFDRTQPGSYEVEKAL